MKERRTVLSPSARHPGCSQLSANDRHESIRRIALIAGKLSSLQNIWELRPPICVEPNVKKRGRRRIRSAEYWRAYYTRKQREWRAANYWRAYYTRKRRERRAAHSRPKTVKRTRVFVRSNFANMS